jgi:drug/metabolite transporter (DMT)-like permease
VVFLGERLGVFHLLAIVLLVLGQIGLVGGFGGIAGFGRPEALILAATLLWAVEVVVAKRLLGAVSSWTVAVTRMGLGSLALIGWVALRGDLGMLTSMTPMQLGWVLVTGVLLAGYVGTWFAALQRAQAVDVTAVLVLAAPLTAALNAAAHGLPLTPQLDWLAVVLAGGALVLWRAWRTQPEPIGVR